MVLHFLPTVKLVARVQKWHVIAVADQFLEFRRAQSLFPQIAEMHAET
jgi:hypothetical protein